VQIRAFFNQAVPAGTQAYAVVISDKLLPSSQTVAGWLWYTEIEKKNGLKFSYTLKNEI